MRSITKPGLMPCSTSQPTPQRSKVPGRKFSQTMSERATRSLNTFAPPGRCRSRVSDFLFRASDNQVSVSPRRVGGDVLRHCGTPTSRGDTLTWLSEARNKKSLTLDLHLSLIHISEPTRPY